MIRLLHKDTVLSIYNEDELILTSSQDSKYIISEISQVIKILLNNLSYEYKEIKE